MSQINIKLLFHGHGTVSYCILRDMEKIYETFLFEIGDIDSFCEARNELQKFMNQNYLTDKVSWISDNILDLP